MMSNSIVNHSHTVGMIVGSVGRENRLSFPFVFPLIIYRVGIRNILSYIFFIDAFMVYSHIPTFSHTPPTIYFLNVTNIKPRSNIYTVSSHTKRTQPPYECFMTRKASSVSVTLRTTPQGRTHEIFTGPSGRGAMRMARPAHNYSSDRKYFDGFASFNSEQHNLI